MAKSPKCIEARHLRNERRLKRKKKEAKRDLAFAASSCSSSPLPPLPIPSSNIFQVQYIRSNHVLITIYSAKSAK